MPKYEILSVAPADPPQWTGDHGTFNAYELELRFEDGTVVKAGVNQKPTSPVPTPGFVYGEAWQNEHGFWKFKRDRAAPKAQQSTQPMLAPADDPVQRMIIRQHSQEMALRWADFLAKTKVTPEGVKIDLNTIEAWTDHFDADVERTSGVAQGPSPVGGQTASAPPQASNGELKISDAQREKFILPKMRMLGVSDEDFGRLLKHFGVEKLPDLPRSRVDEFATALANPIPTGESDVPAEFEPTPASAADDSIPF